MRNNLQNIAEAGVSIWIDDLNRSQIESGELEQLITQIGVVGVTTNPTIFAKAIGAGAGYEAQVNDLALRGISVGEAVRLITAADVRSACDLLQKVAEQSNGRDGRVSIEVDPRLAQDATRTAAEARALWWLVDRQNLFIKIPATQAGLPAITETLSSGISVNVTLIFSIERYQEVLNAFMDGLERRLEKNCAIKNVESVASFFVSRIDTEVDQRLDAIERSGPATKHLRGRAAIANAQLAYALYEQTVASSRWQALKANGARMQRLLWASTGVKDKSYDDTRYVIELVAPDTVNTMPAATLHAVQDHGKARGNAIAGTYETAHKYFGDLDQIGINFNTVVNYLEEQALKTFEKSWDELIASVKTQLSKAGATTVPDGATKPKTTDADTRDRATPPSAAPRS